jgi:FimV-like protein
MSRGQNPLVLMMALSLPGAANALGLGEIHVDSALNEPLAAEIDIVGATAEELSGLTATVANRDTFLRFGAERPAFLSTATFKVSHDVRGRPVLAISSTDAFTEPLVNLLVDLRWHNGEVIRQYSLLLDPAGFPAAPQVAAAVRPSPRSPPTAVAAVLPAATALPASEQAAAVKVTRRTTHVKIGAKATLRGVAWRVGARSESDLKRLMLAIFRANPDAFEGNINRLRLGAVITIPTAVEVANISKDDASREIHAQMAAWRAAPLKPHMAAAVLAAAAPIAAASKTVEVTPTAAAEPPQVAAKAPADSAEVALNLRVQTLEQGLHDMQNQLEREHDKLLGVQAQVRFAEKNPPQAATAPGPAVDRQWLLPSLTAGILLLAGALGGLFLRMRRRVQRTGSTGLKMSLDAAPIAADSIAAKTSAATPVEESTRREPARPAQRPLVQANLTAAWNSVRDKQEAKERELAAAAASQAVASTRTRTIVEVDEEELRAAYEDTLDLSGETAILAAEIAAAGGDTDSPTVATVKMNAGALRPESAAASEAARNAADTARIEAQTASLEAATARIQAESASVDDDTIRDDLERMAGGAATLRVDTTKLDYNLLDLDLTAQHVQMPSLLHEHVVVKERRTNLIDVLKMAIEREPDRRDLRMKLLETYYAAAATNRQGFLDVVQKLARERDRLGDGEWDKIAFMARQIAADSALFSDEPEAQDGELADCA